MLKKVCNPLSLFILGVLSDCGDGKCWWELQLLIHVVVEKNIKTAVENNYENT